MLSNSRVTPWHLQAGMALAPGHAPNMSLCACVMRVEGRRNAQTRKVASHVDAFTVPDAPSLAEPQSSQCRDGECLISRVKEKVHSEVSSLSLRPSDCCNHAWPGRPAQRYSRTEIAQRRGAEFPELQKLNVSTCLQILQIKYIRSL